MKKLIITFIALAIFGIEPALSVRGLGKPVVVKQADGTQITIVVTGDEWSRATLTMDGYQVIQRDGVYYYYEPQAATRSVTDLIKANDPSGRTPREIAALGSRAKGKIDGAYVAPALRPNYSTQLNDRGGVTRASPLGRERLTRVIVLLVQYTDVKFTRTKTDINNWLNVGAQSARQYFTDNSLGKYSPQFDVSSYITLSKPMEYYGANGGTSNSDVRPREMVAEACRAADAAVNFRDYDCDGDGVVDNVCIVFAGHNEAEGGGQNAIWPHNWTISEHLTLDGVKISTYSCTSELRGGANSGNLASGIGTFAHEFSHGLGLSDFYDTDGDTEGQSVGLYEVSLMSQGNYNNNGLTPPYFSALERYLLGWIDLPLLSANQNSVTLQPVQNTGQAYMVKAWGGWSDDEFYIFESRNGQGWDAPMDLTGMLIYHIDRSTNDARGMQAVKRWEQNRINANATHPCVRFIESSGHTVGTKDPLSNVTYPGKNDVRSFTGSSYGGLDWRGTPIAVELINISSTGSGVVSFATRASQGSGKTLSLLPMQRSIKVSFPVQTDVDKIIIGYRTEGSIVATSVYISTNASSYEITGLRPDTRYTVSVSAVKGKNEVLVGSDQCVTMPLVTDFPYITGFKLSYSVGEPIGPITVLNIKDTPQNIEFSVGEEVIDPTLYKVPGTSSFILTCTITYSDNDKEVITRKIKVQ